VGGCTSRCRRWRNALVTRFLAKGRWDPDTALCEETGDFKAILKSNDKLRSWGNAEPSTNDYDVSSFEANVGVITL